MIRHSSDAASGADPAANGSTPNRPGVGDDLRTAWQALAGLAKIEALRVRLKLRNAMWLAVLGVFSGVAFLALTVAASVALFSGIAGAFAELFGGRAWAGNLTAAVLFFAAVLVGIKILRGRGKRERLAAAARTVEAVHQRVRASRRAEYGASGRTDAAHPRTASSDDRPSAAAGAAATKP